MSSSDQWRAGHWGSADRGVQLRGCAQSPGAACRTGTRGRRGARSRHRFIRPEGAAHQRHHAVKVRARACGVDAQDGMSSPPRHRAATGSAAGSAAPTLRTRPAAPAAPARATPWAGSRPARPQLRTGGHAAVAAQGLQDAFSVGVVRHAAHYMNRYFCDVSILLPQMNRYFIQISHSGRRAALAHRAVHAQNQPQHHRPQRRQADAPVRRQRRR